MDNELSIGGAGAWFYMYMYMYKYTCIPCTMDMYMYICTCTFVHCTLYMYKYVDQQFEKHSVWNTRIVMVINNVFVNLDTHVYINSIYSTCTCTYTVYTCTHVHISL